MDGKSDENQTRSDYKCLHKTSLQYGFQCASLCKSDLQINISLVYFHVGRNGNICPVALNHSNYASADTNMEIITKFCSG